MWIVSYFPREIFSFFLNKSFEHFLWFKVRWNWVWGMFFMCTCLYFASSTFNKQPLNDLILTFWFYAQPGNFPMLYWMFLLFVLSFGGMYKGIELPCRSSVVFDILKYKIPNLSISTLPSMTSYLQSIFKTRVYCSSIFLFFVKYRQT